MARSYDDAADHLSFDPAYDDEGERSPRQQFDLNYYLSILRKHKWGITLFTALVTAMAAYYAYTATPIYRATSTLLIESQRASIVSVEEFIGAGQEDSDYYQTQFELLRSRRLAERIVRELELWKLPKFDPESPIIESDSASSEEGADESVLDSALRALKSLRGPSQADDDVEDGTVVSGASPDAPSSEADMRQALIESGLPTRRFTRPSTDSETMSGEASFASGALSRVDIPETGPEFERRFQSAVGWYMSNMTVTPLRGTKLVRLSFESSDPELAAFVANSIGEQYIDSYLDSKMEMTSRASSWLSDRLGTLKAELDDAEDRLIAYKQANGLVDVDGSVGRLNEQELLLATAELAEARSDLASAADLYREVNELRDQPELLESIVAIQGDPLIQQVKIEQGQRQRELDELLNRYGERHPSVIDAKSRLASLDVTMSGHVSRVIGSIEKNFQLLRQRVASIEQKLSAGKRDILVLGTKRFELDELEREVDTRRGLYNTFYSRITEAKSADGLETANARISDLAIVPARPVKPKKQLIIALAALASLVLSILMALLYEQMDTTVKGTDDIEGRLGLKLLGILPLIKPRLLSIGTSTRLPLNPTTVTDKKGTFFESVNTVRTALCMSEGDKPNKVIVVTSSVPGEGKSTASMNLAYSLAQLERVLLVDCDLRRPSVARAAELPSDAVGLTNLITKSANVNRCLYRGVFDGYVDVIPSGPLPEKPLELLSSKRFERILEHLAPHYDRIIIDSAPAQAVSDALVLSKLADAVVYVIKSHETDMSLISRGVERLRQVNAPIAGVVITQVDVEKLAAYGGDHYYQGYYDYYGYNSASDGSGARIRLSKEEMHGIRNDAGSIDDELELDSGLDLGGPATVRRPHSPAAARGGERRVSNDLDII